MELGQGGCGIGLDEGLEWDDLHQTAVESLLAAHKGIQAIAGEDEGGTIAHLLRKPTDHRDASAAGGVEVVDQDRTRLDLEFRRDQVPEIAPIQPAVGELRRRLARVDLLEEAVLESLAARDRADRQVPMRNLEAFQDCLDAVRLAIAGLSVEGDGPGDGDGVLDGQTGIDQWVCVDMTEVGRGVPVLEDLSDLIKGIWDDLCEERVLVRMNLGDFYQVDHEGLLASVVEPRGRFVCDRCHTVTSLAPCAVCPRLRCPGTLRQRDWEAATQTLVARWVSGDHTRFAAVRVAEHTAQIAKSNAEQIERAFRAEDTAGRIGIDVLSSTTTFEMGINIGDLQTVLLRNAPRSSANYVQRVGRAGRGRDKNAICVTLCDRTPYALDVWEKPELIMGGEVRAPTVFLRNALIAQRHFNAYLFADFLRQRILVEKAISKPRQSLEISNFLPKNGLSFIYPDWLPEHRSRVILDFSAWLDEIPEVAVKPPMEAIVAAIGGVEAGLQRAREGYEETVRGVDDEVDIYMAKRLENASTGKSTAGLERTVKNILRENAIDLMAKGGFLPRYAFPLDVVSLETEDSRWTRSDVVLQRDRAVAIVEYAPGATVVANKKSFKSEGLYIATNRDQPKVMHYSRCPDCERVVVYLVKPEFGEDGPPPCECGHRGIKPRPFIEPRAFSVGPDSRKEGRFTRYRRGMSDRQIQSAVSFIDAIPDGEYEPAGDSGAFMLGFKIDGNLFRSNAGPGGKGFAFCRLCGWGLPESEVPKTPRKNHPSLRAWGAKERTCDGALGIRFTSLGHRFTSLCLSVRPVRGFDEGLSVSMAAALQRGICEVLGIDMSDIGVVLQRSPDRIVFYDNTAGGAGFVLEAKDRWSEAEARALQVARDCTCEDACHRCLKHFGNQSSYASLDRKRVVGYLEPQQVADDQRREVVLGRSWAP